MRKPADPTPVERAVKDALDSWPESHLHDGMYDGPCLPDRCTHHEFLTALASSVESATVLEAARAVCGMCAVVQYGKDTDRIRYFAAEGLSPTAWHHRQTIRQDDGSVTVWWRTCAAWAIWRRWPAAREEGRHGDE